MDKGARRHVFYIGPPLSGKSLVAELTAHDLENSSVHSYGDHLRDTQGQYQNKKLGQGALAHSAGVIEWFGKILDEVSQPQYDGHTVLIAGSPRLPNELRAFVEMIEGHHDEVHIVLFDVSPEVAEKRRKRRYEDLKREDDSPVVFNRRWEKYQEQLAALKKEMSRLEGRLGEGHFFVHELDGERNAQYLTDEIKQLVTEGPGLRDRELNRDEWCGPNPERR